MTPRVSTRELNAQSLAYWRQHPIEFIETVLYDPESGQPFELLPAEREFLEHALSIGANGKLKYSEWVYSCPKKSGKTTFEAIIELTLTLLYGGAFPESYILANSLEQGKGRVFEICCRIVNASPLLKGEARITAETIEFPAFNAVIRVIPSDAGTAAGTNAVCSGFDELWSYTSERARRLWDEMTPPPTRKIACRVTVTYAGFEGESVLLEELYRRGKQQPVVGDSLHAGDGLLMAWHTKPVAPWQDDAWATSMRRERASAYQRQFLNEFASSSSQFVDLNKWDRCVRPELGHLHADLFREVFIGVDASVKHDSSAIAVVSFDRSSQMVRLCTHKVFQPSPEQPLDFELTIEAYLLDLKRRFLVRVVRFDPYQMQSTAQRLAKAGLTVEEFPQSSPNLTAASQNLFELINSQALICYPDEELRLAISRAVAIETPRGWRIGKERQAFKIDIVISLAMAAHAAVAAQAEPFFSRDWGWVDGNPIGSPPQSEEQRKAAAKKESADWYQAKLHAYIAQHVGFPPFGRI